MSQQKKRWGTSVLSRVAKLAIKLKLHHDYQRELVLVFSMGGVAFLTTALLTYDPNDASWISASFPPRPTNNLAGTFGAQLSGVFYYCLGLGALVLPMPLLLTGFSNINTQKTTVRRTPSLIGWIFAVVCTVAAATLLVPSVTLKGITMPSGGIFGQWLAGFLNYWLGEVGRLIVMGTLFVCSLCLIFKQTMVSGLISRCNFWMELSISKIREWLPSRGTNHSPLIHQLSIEHESVSPGDTQQDPLLDLSIPVNPNTAAIIEPPIATRWLGNHDLMEPTFTPSKDYQTPPLSIFQKSPAIAKSPIDREELQQTARLLATTLDDFGISGKIANFQPGPVVTVFEFQPESGIKQAKILSLADDLALALKVDSIIIHPVKGKRALGIQVPNRNRQTVFLGDLLQSRDYIDCQSPLTFALGKSLYGEPVLTDLTTMPHLLIAGATGSGKSVAINTLICSTIMKASPEEVRMILVDPKMLELSVYEGIPHLLTPVITEPDRASTALKWAGNEMERRYRLMQQAKVRHITGFNNFWNQAPESKRQEIRDELGDDTIGPLPYLLLVIDELADLMLTAPKDVEASIQRLAQKARASGIHLVLATQRPSVDIITGVIKANLPFRIAFQVVSRHDSRTILDQIGADQLLGKGDLLFQRPGAGRLERVQGAFISDDEVNNLAAKLRESSSPKYDEGLMTWIEQELHKSTDSDTNTDRESIDNRFSEAVAIAEKHGVVSASFLQRHLKIGYNRAARIVEYMESRGMVAGADGSKPRRWLQQSL